MILLTVAFGIIWPRVSELFGARPDIKGMSCVWESTPVSSKLKKPKDLQVILNAAVDETPDEEVGSAYALNPETLRQIIPKSCAI
jgi:hypothetical protein